MASRRPTSNTRIAWLFTRGRESVRLEVYEDESRLGLLVSGPGPQRRFLPAEDEWSLIESQITQESQLRAQGYALEGSTAERRTVRRWAPESVPVEILSRRERSRS